jgi:hypothetical protein
MPLSPLPLHPAHHEVKTEAAPHPPEAGLGFDSSSNLEISSCAYTLYLKFETNIPEMKLRGLVPNFYIYVSESDLYIPTIGPPILLNWERGRAVTILVILYINRILLAVYPNLNIWYNILTSPKAEKIRFMRLNGDYVRIRNDVLYCMYPNES